MGNDFLNVITQDDLDLTEGHFHRVGNITKILIKSWV